MQTIVLALTAAALWGIGDFFGGFGARRAPVLVVLLWSQLAGLTGLVVWVVVAGEGRPPGGSLLAAAGAGLGGAIGLGCLYRGMAIGAMGIVAPISAISPIVPLGVDLARGTTPGSLQWLGIAIALAGVVTVSIEPGSRVQGPLAKGVGLALVAALGFGLFVVGIGEASGESTSWAAATARAGSVVVVVLALLARQAPPRISLSLLPLALAVGVFDTGANVLIVLATVTGPIGIVAVLSALYPLTTILLARVVLHERLGPIRLAGGVLALTGAALIAAG